MLLNFLPSSLQADTLQIMDKPYLHDNIYKTLYLKHNPEVHLFLTFKTQKLLSTKVRRRNGMHITEVLVDSE